MRKQITILGIGNRKTGVSTKTKRPYDFIELSIKYEDPRRMEGEIGEVVSVDFKVVDGILLFPGMVVDAEMWTQNFRTCIGVIYEQ